VGLSRIYLGVHFFPDVAGAIALALLWLGLCLSGVQALWRHRGGGAVHG
jgi:membrane-associated phospholipid phosphatase